MVAGLHNILSLTAVAGFVFVVCHLVSLAA